MNRTMKCTVWAALAAAGGCALEVDRAPAAADDARTGDALGGYEGEGEVEGDALPDDFGCVSAPFGASDVLEPRVVRMQLRRDTGDGYAVVLEEGPQFWYHGEGELPGETRELRQLVLAPEGDGVFSGDDGLGIVTVALARDGLVVRGSVVEDRPFTYTERTLVCWSFQELFGVTAFGTGPGTIPVRFHPEQRTCVDGDGVPTDERNALPIELVRETGMGECADLRGVQLNGEDFGQPRLEHWSLAGAELDGARLLFAHLSGVVLDGADLSDLTLGYATIDGSVDGNTELPADVCTVEDSPLGPVATCVQ